MLDYKCYNLSASTKGYIGKEEKEVESESAYKELYEDYHKEQKTNGN